MLQYKILYNTRSVKKYKMSKRKRYIVDEAVKLIDQDDDLAEIHAADLSDTESDNGDMEEADYVSASDEATLVSHGHLCSPIAEDDADEPALQDSLVLHDTELSEEQDPQAEGKDFDDEPNETDGVSDVHVDDHSSSSAESANDDDSAPLSVSSTSDSSSPAEVRTYRHSNRREGKRRIM